MAGAMPGDRPPGDSLRAAATGAAEPGRPVIRAAEPGRFAIAAAPQMRECRKGGLILSGELICDISGIERIFHVQSSWDALVVRRDPSIPGQDCLTLSRSPDITRIEICASRI